MWFHSVRKHLLNTDVFWAPPRQAAPQPKMRHRCGERPSQGREVGVTAEVQQGMGRSKNCGIKQGTSQRKQYASKVSKDT